MTAGNAAHRGQTKAPSSQDARIRKNSEERSGQKRGNAQVKKERKGESRAQIKNVEKKKKKQS